MFSLVAGHLLSQPRLYLQLTITSARAHRPHTFLDMRTESHVFPPFPQSFLPAPAPGYSPEHPTLPSGAQGFSRLGHSPLRGSALLQAGSHPPQAESHPPQGLRAAPGWVTAPSRWVTPPSSQFTLPQAGSHLIAEFCFMSSVLFFPN